MVDKEIPLRQMQSEAIGADAVNHHENLFKLKEVLFQYMKEMKYDVKK